MYEPKLEFPGGWGFKPKTPLWGEYGYFPEQHIEYEQHLVTSCSILVGQLETKALLRCKI